MSEQLCAHRRVQRAIGKDTMMRKMFEEELIMSGALSLPRCMSE